jgi:hypothetical protein
VTEPPRYEDFVQQQRIGAVHGVFIDDTGSPGLETTPAHLHAERRSWVAVFVPRSVISEVWEQFPPAIVELRRLTGATEFHFADIYGGKRQFKGVPLDRRLAIFGFMAQIFNTYRFPIFVQTLDPDSLQDVRSGTSLPERLGPFDLRRPNDLALFFLLLRVKWHLETSYPETNRQAHVFVDEGFQRNGAAIVLAPLRGVFADGLVCFARSDSILPIQLADFAAFSLNRSQLLLGRAGLSNLDESLLRIIEPIAWNVQNIPKISLSDWFPETDQLLH